MHFNNPFTENDIIRADKASVTPHMIADATFEGIRAAYTFQKFYLKKSGTGFLLLAIKLPIIHYAKKTNQSHRFMCLLMKEYLMVLLLNVLSISDIWPMLTHQIME